MCQERAAWDEPIGEETQMELMQQVLQRENLIKAYKRVVQNDGAPGVDGMSVQELGKYCRTHWPSIRQALLEGTYEPQPVRSADIPKPGSKEVRTLGIPTVVDRLIQQALHQVLTPIFDPTFSECNFGYRPGRSAHNAIRAVQGYIEEGYDWVVDLDLERFFDRVQHDVLMARVARRVKDKKVLRLIRKFLQSGIMKEGLATPRMEGTPQGGPLSPLLSNILLDELDQELERRGHRFARYADDVNVYVRSQKAGERVMASLEAFLTKRLRLIVNQEKSAVARPWERAFLGFTFTRQVKPQIGLPKKTIQRFKAKLRPVFRKGRGRRLEDTVAQLNPILTGWLAYYRVVEVKSGIRDLMGWVRHRIRCLMWRQWKTPRTRFKKLQKYGLSERSAAKLAYSGHSPWHSSKRREMNVAIKNRVIHKGLGLIDMHQRHLRFMSGT